MKNIYLILVAIGIYLLTRKASAAALPNTAMNLTSPGSPSSAPDPTTPGFTIGDTSNFVSEVKAPSLIDQAKDITAKAVPALAAVKAGLGALGILPAGAQIGAVLSTSTIAIPASLAPSTGLLAAGSVPAGGFTGVTIPAVVAPAETVAAGSSAAAAGGASVGLSIVAAALPIAIVAWVAAAWGVFEPYDPHAGSQQIRLKDGRFVWISNALYDELGKGNTGPLNAWLAAEQKQYEDSKVYTQQTQQAVETKADVIKITAAIAKKTNNTNTRL